MRAGRAEQESITIRLGLRDEARCDIAARTGAIIGDKRDAEFLVQLHAKPARVDVGGGASGEAADDGNRVVGPRLGVLGRSGAGQPHQRDSKQGGGKRDKSQGKSRGKSAHRHGNAPRAGWWGQRAGRVAPGPALRPVYRL
ncbi:hypothetical protein D3C87_1543650 [compost metagenome]